MAHVSEAVIGFPEGLLGAGRFTASRRVTGWKFDAIWREREIGGI